MEKIVPESPRKGNNRFNTLLLAALVVLVALAAFGLGRLSVSNPQEGSLIIHEPPQGASN